MNRVKTGENPELNTAGISAKTGKPAISWHDMTYSFMSHIQLLFLFNKSEILFQNMEMINQNNG